MVVVDRLRLENIPIEKLIPNPENPRVDLQKGTPLYEKLYQSIQHHTYIDPIIWNERSGYIVAGHQRFQVLKDMAFEDGTELKTIPVIVVNLDEKEERTFLVSDNKVQGLWNTEKLTALFRKLEEEDLPYTGFDDFEIQSLLNDDSVNEDIEIIDEDVEVDAPTQFTVTLVCENDDDISYLKDKFNEAMKLKRRYKVSELREVLG